MNKEWDRHWKEVFDKERHKDGPEGFIQWKGTNACLDLHCKCGHHGHVDDSFVYYYECPKCKTLFALSSRIELIELDEWNSQYVKKERSTVIKTSEDACYE